MELKTIFIGFIIIAYLFIILRFTVIEFIIQVNDKLRELKNNQNNNN